jgi:hypothetical protein
MEGNWVVEERDRRENSVGLGGVCLKYSFTPLWLHVMSLQRNGQKKQLDWQITLSPTNAAPETKQFARC